MGTSRQRLRVAKSHELPKVVSYQRMQVTKRYGIPRVSCNKRYEDQKICDHVVIQEDTNGSGPKGYERNGTKKGTRDSIDIRTPLALCWAWTHTMAMGCQLGEGKEIAKALMASAIHTS
ncbi:hypothetical protein Rs2_35633 [Raphanus sativus]|nr:hypothetical protein Rs2_35633 [Raphanus sativus]